MLLLCAIAGLAKRTYHNIHNNIKNNRISKREKDQEGLTKQIKELIRLPQNIDCVNSNNVTFTPGRRTMTKMLLALNEETGLKVTEYRVRKIMLSLGISGRAKRRQSRYSSYKGEISPICDNEIKRDFIPDTPATKIYADVTEFNITQCEDKLYLSLLTDGYSGAIIGYSIDKSPTVVNHLKATVSALDLCSSLRKKFPEINSKILIHHSDQGIHYQSVLYKKILTKYLCQQSMSRKGNCLDNALCESTFARLKGIMFHQNKSLFNTLEEAKAYIEFSIFMYNYIIPKERLGMLSPYDYLYKNKYGDYLPTPQLVVKFSKFLGKFKQRHFKGIVAKAATQLKKLNNLIAKCDLPDLAAAL